MASHAPCRAPVNSRTGRKPGGGSPGASRLLGMGGQAGGDPAGRPEEAAANARCAGCCTPRTKLWAAGDLTTPEHALTKLDGLQSDKTKAEFAAAYRKKQVSGACSARPGFVRPPTRQRKRQLTARRDGNRRAHLALWLEQTERRGKPARCPWPSALSAACGPSQRRAWRSPVA